MYYLLECEIVGWEVIGTTKKIIIRPSVVYSGTLANGEKPVGLMIEAESQNSFKAFADNPKVTDKPEIKAVPKSLCGIGEDGVGTIYVSQFEAPTVLSSAILRVEEAGASYKVVGVKIPND